MSNQTIDYFGSQARVIDDVELRKHILDVVQKCFSHVSNFLPDNIIPSLRASPFTSSEEQLHQLRTKRYYLHEKTDGNELYVLFTTFRDMPFAIGITPSNSALHWEIVMLPNIFVAKHMYKNTLVYGTVVLCGQTDKWLFVCSDIVQIAGSWDVTRRSFVNRLKILNRFVLNVEYGDASASGPHAPFSFVSKKYARTNNKLLVAEVLDSITKSSYPCSGLLITPDEHELSIGRQNNFFKWEPIQHATVYLLCRLVDDRVLLYADGQHLPIATQGIVDTFVQSLLSTDDGNSNGNGSDNITDIDIAMDEQSYEEACESVNLDIRSENMWMYEKKLKQFNNEIIESYWNSERKLWHYKCIRKNKPRPTHASIVYETQKSVEANLSLEQIVDILQANGLDF
jgi:hypothetical protein